MNPHPNDPKGQAGAAKTPLHLIPTVALNAEAEALRQGAEKYQQWNWRESGIHATTYIGSILRHLVAWRDGEDADPESGISHLGHIRANCAILLDAAHVGKLVDDRPVHRVDEGPYPKCHKCGGKMMHTLTESWCSGCGFNGDDPDADLCVPDGLPPLPPVPEGFDRWVYRGTGWTNDHKRCTYAHPHGTGWAICQCVPHGRGDTHYIEAVTD